MGEDYELRGTSAEDIVSANGTMGMRVGVAADLKYGKGSEGRIIIHGRWS